MSKFSFENLHRNHKWAFIDGLLCGAAIAYTAMQLRQNRLMEDTWAPEPISEQTDTPSTTEQ